MLKTNVYTTFWFNVVLGIQFSSSQLVQDGSYIWNIRFGIKKDDDLKNITGTTELNP
ncbi:MAG: hypothetical protein HYR91_12750 [Flavobacteriia bacterium]|nr:hypothetical protein [Flavobacteriia bacterium]